jgi:hypothetical protein
VLASDATLGSVTSAHRPQLERFSCGGYREPWVDDAEFMVRNLAEALDRDIEAIGLSAAKNFYPSPRGARRSPFGTSQYSPWQSVTVVKVTGPD